MASETPLKRQREEEEEGTQDNIPIHEETKRLKSYNDILSLLEQEEEEEQETQDISSLINTLQQELSSSDGPQNPLEDSPCACSSDSSTATSKTFEEEEEEDDGVKVMRHLLEASDDELGLPNAAEEKSRLCDNNIKNDLFVDNNNLGGYSFGDGLWEFEDEAANYYTMLQSELFM